MGCGYDPEQMISDYRKEINCLTRMLCLMCKQSAKGKVPDMTNSEIAEWWANHKEVDRRRITNEREKKRAKIVAERAKGKLTKAEVRALGL